MQPKNTESIESALKNNENLMNNEGSENNERDSENKQIQNSEIGSGGSNEKDYNNF